METRSSNSWHWKRTPELDSRVDSAASSEKRLFAIVSGPIPVGSNGKTIQRVLIFDDHPASLRLVLESSEPSRLGQAFARSGRLIYAAGAIAAGAIIGVALLWPLW